jgi:hypothetical protein
MTGRAYKSTRDSGFFYVWRAWRIWFGRLFDKFAWSKFARATKFAGSKFERAWRGPKGELQEVIRNGARRAAHREVGCNLSAKKTLDACLRRHDAALYFKHQLQVTPAKAGVQRLSSIRIKDTGFPPTRE